MTSTAGCKMLFLRSTSRAILQTPRVHPLPFKAACSGSGTKYSGYVPCDADIRLVFRPYHRILRGSVPSAGVTSHKKSELRAHRMARRLRSPGVTPQKSELSSHQMARECEVPGSLRTKNPRRALMIWGACPHLQRCSTSSVTMFRAVPMSLHRLYFGLSAPLVCLWEVFSGMYYMGSTAAVARAY